MRPTSINDVNVRSYKSEYCFLRYYLRIARNLQYLPLNTEPTTINSVPSASTQSSTSSFFHLTRPSYWYVQQHSRSHRKLSLAIVSAEVFLSADTPIKLPSHQWTALSRDEPPHWVLTRLLTVHLCPLVLLKEKMPEFYLYPSVDSLEKPGQVLRPSKTQEYGTSASSDSRDGMK